MSTSGIKFGPITQDRLHELLAYDPETGEFRWKVHRGGTARAGSIAGARDSDGYLQIKIDGRLYLAHRLAWLYVYGIWPDRIVDHCDKDHSNNAFANLRLATDCESLRNQGIKRNNKSGFKGISWNKSRRAYSATICDGQRRRFLGYFDDPAEASAAYCKAAADLHGAFARAA